MDQIALSLTATPRRSAKDIASYRRDGYVVARGVLGPRSVAACTVPHESAPPGEYVHREGMNRPVVPVDALD